MVNIRNMPETFEHDPEKWLENIFEAQRKLLSEYKVIERFDHLVDDDGKLKSMQALESQVLLKEFLLRIIAEWAEMIEADREKHHVLHKYEEVSDILHFSTELLLFIGVSPKDVNAENVFEFQKDFFEEVHPTKGAIVETPLTKIDYQHEVAYHWAIADNCLKTKKWKTSQIISDEEEFKKRVIVAYRWTLRMFAAMDLVPRDLTNFYFRKNKVNNFRIESKY